MASNVNSLLGIGAGALYAHQNSIQTTGNNIANVDTEGYSRQKVRYETNPSQNAYPGQIGQGVRATEVYRMFNIFVEKAYINKNSDASRWAEQHALLRNVDALVYESDTVPGIADSLTGFFDGWQVLSQNGSLLSNREALLSNATNLTAFIREQNDTLAYMQQQMDGLIQADVDKANRLMQDIAQLNREISIYSIPGQNNPNSLLDQRDLKVRQLSEIIDIDIVDKGEGRYTVNTKSGYTLVHEDKAFALEFATAGTIKYLDTSSTYTGELNFTGTDEYEYTVEIVTGGAVIPGGIYEERDTDNDGIIDLRGVFDPATNTLVPGAATFRVSIDGGRTWLEDRNGNSIFACNETNPATSQQLPVFIKDLQITFDAGSGLTAGDTFEVMPKSGLYWNNPTESKRVNITPQTLSDGTMNSRRSTGGTLTSYFEFRDHLLGDYRERLDTFASTVAWEVNRVHSQGVGLEKLTSILGDYQTQRTGVPLGSTHSGLPWADRLQAGNFTIALYDQTTGDALYDSPGMQTMLNVNFDPATDSLDDLVASINAAAAVTTAPAGGATPPYITASIVDGRLKIESATGITFGVGNDTSGVLAGLGVNTFFKGENAGDIAVRDDIVQNINLINAAAINGGAEGNVGDTAIALEIAQLKNKKLSITSSTGKTTEQTMVAFYATYVTKVGADTQTANYNSSLYGAMAGDLRSQQDSNSGVNLDEEMTNLVKFQNSYKAAAKLITTADEMLQTILGLKQ